MEIVDWIRLALKIEGVLLLIYTIGYQVYYNKVKDLTTTDARLMEAIDNYTLVNGLIPMVNLIVFFRFRRAVNTVLDEQ